MLCGFSWRPARTPETWSLASAARIPGRGSFFGAPRGLCLHPQLARDRRGHERTDPDRARHVDLAPFAPGRLPKFDPARLRDLAEARVLPNRAPSGHLTDTLHAQGNVSRLNLIKMPSGSTATRPHLPFGKGYPEIVAVSWVIPQPKNREIASSRGRWVRTTRRDSLG
jgi:hypothetical protein